MSPSGAVDAFDGVPTVNTASASTPEDLLAMPDGNAFELVGGPLVERNMGAESSRVGGKLFSRLDRF